MATSGENVGALADFFQCRLCEDFPMTEVAEDVTAEIGLAAGMIWSFLHENGASSVNRLIRELDVSRELVMLAVGWLAREDKLVFQKLGRGRTIALK